MVERDINYQSWARVIFSRHHFTRERDVIWSNYQPSPLLQPLGGERNQYRGPEAGTRANFLGDFKSGANCLAGRSRGEQEPIVWLVGAGGNRSQLFGWSEPVGTGANCLVGWSWGEPEPIVWLVGARGNQSQLFGWSEPVGTGANCLVGRSRGEPEPIVWLDGARGTRAAYFRKAKKSLVLVLSMNPVNLFI